MKSGSRFKFNPTILLHFELYLQKFQFLPVQNQTDVISRSAYRHLQTETQGHTSSVNSIANLEHNKVLGAHPPAISDSEKALPRITRTTLSQLRSGYSTHLKSYMSRISKEVPVPDVCPLCQQPGHTTVHLFSCPANPTTLTPRDLWINPLECARFLNLPITDDDAE